MKQSLTGHHWVDRLSPDLDRTALSISQKLGLPEILARILAGRDVSEEEALDYLNPTIKGLMPDPNVMTDMEAAAERIAKAIINQENVAIFGDYDVDGATSSALLFRFLSAYGVKARIYIPDRIIEGYGPNPEAMKILKEEGATLIVTVDCGVVSFEALEWARNNGLDVVVLDHHQVGVELPPAVAIVNPNRQDDVSGLGHLAAVGVVFMTCVATQRILRNSTSSLDQRSSETDPTDSKNNFDKQFNLLTLLDLVALGTICDVVPLKTLNRAFVAKGLIAMRYAENNGIAALAKAARIDGPLEAGHMGFALGPRINAGGRIGNASLGAQLLTLTDSIEVEEIASRLDVLNGERQAMEKAVLTAADAQAAAEVGDDEQGGPGILIASDDDWHPGILGIVASRLKERYRRPSFVIGFDRNGKGTGSGRSISGIDLGKVVREAVAEGLLAKGGGHAMAAGLTVQKSRLADLRLFFEERLGEKVREIRQEQVLTIDAALTARGATLDLLNEIERAGPYGAGNPTPIFAFPAHKISYANIVGNSHVRLSLKASDGATINAIAFGAAETELGKFLLSKTREPIHVAGTLSKNTWQGRTNVQIRVIDAAAADY